MNRGRGYVGRLEAGNCLPLLEDLLALSVIYNKTFEDHFTERLSAARATVRAGLPQLPISVGDQAAFRQVCMSSTLG